MQSSSRLIPFTIAGIVCFLAAFLLGAVAWYFFFGAKPRSVRDGDSIFVQTGKQNPSENNSNAVISNVENIKPAAIEAVAAAATPEVKKAPAGEIKIAGGEVTLGGDDTKLPLRRVNVPDFFIGETEVTKAQYAEFVAATEHRAPDDWRGGKSPPETEDEPVTGVTWTDANEYCAWLSKETGAIVRLPTEAEWERAARGDTDNKYAWGEQWSDEAAQSPEAKGKIRSVKSFPAGRTPEGVYEMIGNVWEWTSDLAVDEFGKPVLFGGKFKQRIIKGGSAKESLLKNEEREKFMTIDAHLFRPEEKASELLGFRYVVIRK
jgi:toxoflavin biosynthesis protein ToxD